MQLRCYVVIELKTTGFKPAYAGQINFYVNAVDDLLRHETDQPTIGIVLCRSQHETIVRYALQGMNQPIGVSTYRTAAELPAEYQGKLPSAEELQAQIDSAIASLVLRNREERWRSRVLGNQTLSFKLSRAIAHLFYYFDGEKRSRSNENYLYLLFWSNL